MDKQKPAFEPAQLSREKALSLFRGVLGYPNPDEEPRKPGPWDPVMRTALHYVALQDAMADSRLAFFARFNPAIWDVIGGNPLSRVALNPQPLPPAALFASAVAAQVIHRAVLAQDLADITSGETAAGSRSVVGGYLRSYEDDWCPTRPKFPFPGPPLWWKLESAALDLMVVGVMFNEAARQTLNAGLAKDLSHVGEKFLDAGLAR